MKKAYLIYREHRFESGSRKSWNAIAEIKEIYPSGILEADYDNRIDFKSRKEAKAYCKANDYTFITHEDYEKEWSKARAVYDTYEEAVSHMNKLLAL